MSDTPETNAAAFDPFAGQGGEVVDADFSRKLERERDEARKAAIALIEKGCDRECAPLYYAQRLERERDEAREALKSIANWEGGLGAKWPQDIARDFLARSAKEGAK